MRRIIVNADDFGLTAGVNRAIGETHSKGLVTSATLMANSAAFEDAVQIAKNLPQLSVGCHVTLVNGAPLLAPSKIPTLIDRSPSHGFRESLSAFAASALTGQLAESEIEEETTAQIRQLQGSGIEVSHLDTHKHTHMFPPVFRALLRSASVCGVPAIRNPYSPRKPVPLQALWRRPGLWKRYLQVRGLRRLRAGFLRAVSEAGIVTTEGSLGIVSTGSIDLGLFEKIAESIPPGIWELVCHPGYSDSDLDRVRTRLRQSREEELKLLMSSEARAALARHGIELLSYRDLVASQNYQPRI